MNGRSESQNRVSQSLNRVRISWGKEHATSFENGYKRKICAEFLDKIRVGIHSVDFLLSLKCTHLTSAGKISVILIILCPKATTPLHSENRSRM